MDKFRCPTCLTMLEGGELRCPACHSRLRKRGQPIVLGDPGRAGARRLFPFERDLQARVEASNDPDHPWHRPHVSLSDRASGAQARDPQPEALEALLAFEAAVVADTARETDAAPPRIIDLTTETLLDPAAAQPPEPVDIDLTLERDPETVNELAIRRASLSPSIEREAARDADIHEIFEALNKKARAVPDETDPATPGSRPEASGTSRAEHPAATGSRGRRWTLTRRRQPEPGNS
jgi:hypothetical protein